MSVEVDRARFHQKVKEEIRKNVKNIVNGGFTSVKGGKLIKVPLRTVKMPSLKYGEFGDNDGGVGRGDGKEGDIIGAEPIEGKNGQGAGNQEGQHGLYADFSVEELIDILGEELSLPNILPKGKRNIEGEQYRYDSVAQTGPRSLRHKKKTLKDTILRSMLDNGKGKNKLVPYKDNFKYRSWKVKPYPLNSAVVFYMMDISGSMSENQLNIVKNVGFWIENWLKKFYDIVHIRYILHDTKAGEVTRDEFYRYTAGGGTHISTAFQKMYERIKLSYPVEDWNIYPFYFGDGDNWTEDNETAIKVIKDDLIDIVNQLSICLIKNGWWESGMFGKNLVKAFENDPRNEKIAIANIQEMHECLDAIKIMLGRGN